MCAHVFVALDIRLVENPDARERLGLLYPDTFSCLRDPGRSGRELLLLGDFGLV
jgi:hypothetical protein